MKFAAARRSIAQTEILLGARHEGRLARHQLGTRIQVATAVEPVVGQALIAACPIEPTRPGLWVGIELRHVGLDVEQGGVVEDVEFANVEDIAAPAEEADRRESDGVRPIGRTGGEQTMILRVPVGNDA